MSEMVLYKQKEFSRLTNLSRKALLIYENKSILKPYKVETSNGYRFYSEKELEIGLTISFLKNLDLPLSAISEIIKNEVGLKDELKKHEISYHLQKKMRGVLNSISALNLCVSNPNLLKQKLYIKSVPPATLITIESWGDVRTISTSFSLLNKEIARLSILVSGIPFTYYFKDSTAERLHYKACYPIATFIDIEDGDIKTERFSGFKTASIMHFGSYELLPNRYKKLKELMTREAIISTGDFVELYLTREERFYSNSSSLITEIGAVL